MRKQVNLVEINHNNIALFVCKALLMKSMFKVFNCLVDGKIGV